MILSESKSATASMGAGEPEHRADRAQRCCRCHCLAGLGDFDMPSSVQNLANNVSDLHHFSTFHTESKVSGVQAYPYGDAVEATAIPPLLDLSSLHSYCKCRRDMPVLVAFEESRPAPGIDHARRPSHMT